MKTAVVKSSDLGNCWSVSRFIKGHRCARVDACNYPEKKTCQAVQAEVDYLNHRVEDIKKGAKDRIEKVQSYRDKLAKGEKTSRDDKFKAGEAVAQWQDE